jgi:acetyl-CoA carboxylase carboxyl transferase subunit beta
MSFGLISPSMTARSFSRELDVACSSAREWIELLCDQGSFQEYFPSLESVDPIYFHGDVKYKDRLGEVQKETNLKEAVVVGKALLNSMPAVLSIFDFSFLGGSLGAAAGEKITRAMELAIKEKLGFVNISLQEERGCRRGYFHLCRWRGHVRL